MVTFWLGHIETEFEEEFEHLEEIKILEIVAKESKI